MKRVLLSCTLVACASNDGPEFEQGEDCGTEAPTFTEVFIEDGGIRTIGGEERPTVQVSAQVDDADGDLHSYSVSVWYDTRDDGELRSDPEIVRSFELSDAVCGVMSARLGMLLPVGGRDVPDGTDVEFGLVIKDAAGNASNDGVPVIAVGRTPSL